MPDPKETNVQIPETMTMELAAIAHIRNISLEDALREALEEYIPARRNDEGFKERLEKLLEEDRRGP
jgi:hypothetical protein